VELGQYRLISLKRSLAIGIRWFDAFPALASLETAALAPFLDILNADYPALTLEVIGRSLLPVVLREPASVSWGHDGRSHMETCMSMPERFKDNALAQEPQSPTSATMNDPRSHMHSAIEHANQRRQQLLRWLAELVARSVSETAKPRKGPPHAEEQL